MNSLSNAQSAPGKPRKSVGRRNHCRLCRLWFAAGMARHERALKRSVKQTSKGKGNAQSKQHQQHRGGGQRKAGGKVMHNAQNGGL